MIKKLPIPLLIAVSMMFSAAVFGQTTQLNGKVLAVSSTTITLQTETDVWDIKRTQTTTVTGTLKVGSTVTVTYNAPDGQKREGPVTTGTTSPTPAGQ